MSGTRHHFIPRWLQAGFADNGAGKKSRAWLYRQHWEGPRNVATKDIGLEEHFYSYGTGTERCSADEVLTKEEAGYAALARRLRTPGAPPPESHESLARLFAHLEVRTKNFRDYVASACEPLIAAFTAHVHSPEMFRPYVSELVRARPEVFDAALAASKLKLTTADVALLSSTNPYSAAEQSVIARLLQLPWGKLLTDAVRAGHVEALLDTASDARCLQYSECQFLIRDYPTANFVQGDAPVSFRLQNGKYTSLVIGRGAIDFAFLPLTPTRLLIAKRDQITLPAWQELRKAHIACSRDYFIAAVNNAELKALLPLVGTDVPLIGQEQISMWMQEALAEALDSSNCGDSTEHRIVASLLANRAVR